MNIKKKKPTIKTINISFRINAELKRILEKMAALEQRSQAQIMIFALQDYAKKLKVEI